MLPDYRVFIPAVVVLTLLFYSVVLSLCHGEQLTASWYSVESCRKEGSSGIMANGEALDDNKFTAASWDYRFQTRIKVTNTRNGKSVVVRVSDRGPAKRWYREGRVVDLSKAAFSSIADLREGVIPISIEEVK